MRQLDLFGLKEEQQPAEPLENNNVTQIFAHQLNDEIFDIKENEFLDKLNSENLNVPFKQQKEFGDDKIIEKKRGRKSFKEIDAELDLIKIPKDEILFQKQYYSISIVAEWFNVNASLLRFWVNEFTILKPRKNKKGDRLFRPEDVKNLELIYYLLRHRKFSIEGAKKYLEENKQNADTNFQAIQSLTKLRGFLLELKANLEK